MCRMSRTQAVAGDIAERHQDYSVQAMTNFVWGATALGFFDEVLSWQRLQCCGHAALHDWPHRCSAVGCTIVVLGCRNTARLQPAHVTRLSSIAQPDSSGLESL